MINIHNKVTIKNGTINGKVYARNNSNITFENIKFSGAISDNLSTEGHPAIQAAVLHYMLRIACSLQHLFLAHRLSLYHTRVVAAI